MLYFLEGGKGGVGKSIMSSILIDCLSRIGRDVVIIDTDTSNPDVYRAHHKKFPCFLQKIDTVSDWADFLTLLDEHSNKDVVITEENKDDDFEKHIIVNMGARNQESIQSWGETIKEISEDICVFFMLNNQKDSILLLKEYTKVIEPKYIVPTKNHFFGDQNAFSLYDNCETKKLFSREFYIEEVIPSAANKFYTDRIPLSEIPDALNVGDRIFFQRWLKDTKKRLNELKIWY